jgi:putative hemin transport protein
MTLTLVPRVASHPGEAAVTAVREGYAQARRHGAVRHRDIAAQLRISEGELIGAHAGAADGRALMARRLRRPFPSLVAALESVGPVMALTRNASCVHEKIGVYRDASVGGPAGREMGLVLGGAIDLRLFYRHWVHGFAVDELSSKGLQSSLQFFDAQGDAVHKVFARDDTDRSAWVRFVAQHLDQDHTGAGIDVAPAAAPQAESPDAHIDVAGLREGWASLRDTHEFFALLKRFEVTRMQALRLADERFVQRLDASDIAATLLHGAAASAVPIMVFVGNPGTIQIHSGTVQRVVPTGPWINVLDEGFSLHLRQDHVASAWLVRKPTVDGLVCSVELFDAGGDTIAMFFGERKPGRAESCAWRTLLDTIAPGAFPEPLHSCAC